jgi:catechol 2,3-dioxygenase-like lactoylglutathione lyase family enzyme
MSCAIKSLGEIAFRVDDLETMQKFYEEVIGLKLMKRFPQSAFFEVAQGYGGHTQVLALFDRSTAQDYPGLSSEKSTVDHIAFAVSLADFDSEKERLEDLGMQVDTSEHS